MTDAWPYIVAALVALAFFGMRQLTHRQNRREVEEILAMAPWEKSASSRPPDARTAAPDASPANGSGETRNAASAALRGEERME